MLMCAQRYMKAHLDEAFSLLELLRLQVWTPLKPDTNFYSDKPIKNYCDLTRLTSWHWGHIQESTLTEPSLKFLRPWPSYQPTIPLKKSFKPYKALINSALKPQHVTVLRRCPAYTNTRYCQGFQHHLELLKPRPPHGQTRPSATIEQ